MLLICTLFFSNIFFSDKKKWSVIVVLVMKSNTYAGKRAMHSHTYSSYSSYIKTPMLVLLFVCSNGRESFRCFFLITLCFLRAHPSVKLGTFTRVDTKTAHSRFSQIRRNIKILYELIWTGHAMKLLNVEKNYTKKRNSIIYRMIY